MKTSIPKVLLCDDDALIHMSIKHALKDSFKWSSVYSTEEARLLARKECFDIALIDMGLKRANEGLELISELKEIDRDLPIIVFSGRTDLSLVKQALRLGAEDYLSKDSGTDDLRHTLVQAVEHRKLKRLGRQHDFEITSAHEGKYPFIGESEAIRKLRQTLERIRDLDANIVITGETGTGKEVVARQLRQRTPDGQWLPFVAVDSSTIQQSTAESTLFGYEKGAFTGAEKSTKGLFEEADGGTIYFDEISNMPLGIQAKLLRAIQEKEITRLGSTKTLQLSFRVICATNVSLEELIAKGTFKHDLFQRLSVIPIQVPALRERKEDLPLLIEHFVRRHGKGRQRLEFSAQAMERIRDYSWPGNIRELGNLIALLFAITDQGKVGLEHLPSKICASSPTPKPTIVDQALGLAGDAVQTAKADFNRDFYSQMSDYEKQILLDAYERLGKNISRMSQVLKMDRSHLYAKLRQHAIHGNAAIHSEQ